MIDVRFTTADPGEVRNKLSCARELETTVQCRMSPPRGRSYITLAGRHRGDDYWGDLEVVEAGRLLLTVRGDDHFEGRVNPASGPYEYRIFSPEAR